MESKLHYKMYKDGKKWVFAGLTAFSLVVAGGTQVKADEAGNQNTQTTAATQQSDLSTSQQQAQSALQDQAAQAKQKFAATKDIQADQVTAFNKQADQLLADQVKAVQAATTTTAVDQIKTDTQSKFDKLVQDQQLAAVFNQSNQNKSSNQSNQNGSTDQSNKDSQNKDQSSDQKTTGTDQSKTDQNQTDNSDTSEGLSNRAGDAAPSDSTNFDVYKQSSSSADKALVQKSVRLDFDDVTFDSASGKYVMAFTFGSGQGLDGGVGRWLEFTFTLSNSLESKVDKVTYANSKTGGNYQNLNEQSDKSYFVRQYTNDTVGGDVSVKIYLDPVKMLPNDWVSAQIDTHRENNGTDSKRGTIPSSTKPSFIAVRSLTYDQFGAKMNNSLLATYQKQVTAKLNQTQYASKSAQKAQYQQAINAVTTNDDFINKLNGIQSDFLQLDSTLSTEKGKLDGDVTDAKNTVNGFDGLDATTKSNIIQQLSPIGINAFNQMLQANSNDQFPDIEKSATDQINTIVSEAKSKSGVNNAQKDLQAYGDQKKTSVDGLSDFDDQGKQDAKNDIQSAVDQWKATIASKTSDADIQNALSDGKKAIDAVVVNQQKGLVDTRNNATTDIDNAEKTANDTINGLSDISSDHKSAALAQVKTLADNARATVTNSKAPSTIKKTASEAVTNIQNQASQAQVWDKQDRAIKNVQSYAEGVQADLKNLPASDDVKAAQNKVQEIANKPGFDNATTDDQISAIETQDKTAMDQQRRTLQLKQHGADIVAKVQAMTSLDNKSAVIDKVNQLVNNAVTKIGQDSTPDAVDQDYNQAFADIDSEYKTASQSNAGALTAAQAAAKAKIQNAANDARDKINGLSNIDKDAALKKVQSDEDAANAAVDKATSADAASQAGQAGETQLTKDGNDAALADAKNGANKAIGAKQAAAKQAIDANNQLSATEKQSYKQAVDKAAGDAVDKINGESDINQVEPEKNTGEQNIQAQLDAANLRGGKNDGTGQVSDAKDKAIAEINQFKNIIAQANGEAQANVQQAAQDAINAIEAAGDQGGIDSAVKTGKLKMHNYQQTAALAAYGKQKADQVTAMKNLTAPDKQTYTDQINQAVTDWQNQMAQESSQDAIDSDLTQGKAAVDAALKQAQQKNASYKQKAQDIAEGAINGAAEAAINRIKNKAGFRDNHQQEQIDKVNADKDKALAAVQAAETEDDVNTTSQTWQNSLSKDGDQAILVADQDAATTAVLKSQTDTDSAIDQLGNLSDSDKQSFKNTVDQAQTDASSDIPKQTDAAGAQSVQQTAQQKMEAALAAAKLKNGQNAGTQEVNTAKQKAIAEIQKLQQTVAQASADGEKNVKDAADSAINNINAANSQNDIDTAVTQGTLQIHIAQQQTTLSAHAKQQKDIIDQMANLSNDDKKTAKQAIDGKVTSWNNQMKQDATKDAVDQDYNKGAADIDDVVSQQNAKNDGYKAAALAAAKSAISSAADQAFDVIRKQGDLTDGHRTDANGQVTTDRDQALSRLDQAGTVAEINSILDAAKTQLSTDSANAVLKNAQDGATQAIAQQQESAKQTIQNMGQLTNQQKRDYQHAVDEAASQATTAIQQQKSTDAVTNSKNSGQTNIQQALDGATLRNGKNDGQGQVATAKQQAINEIDALKQTVKDAAQQADQNVGQTADDAIQKIENATKQADIDQAVKQAKNQIHISQQQTALAAYGQQKLAAIKVLPNLKDPDRQDAERDIQQAVSTWQNKMASDPDEATVDADLTNGKNAIDGIYQQESQKNDQYKGDAQRDANAAIDSAESEALRKLDGLTDLTPDHKEAAVQRVKDDAQQARTNLDQAKTEADVNTAREKGQNTLNKDVDDATLRNGKDKAQAAIDSNLADAERDIDAQGKLSDPEKAAAKAALKEAASAAKTNIENAADQKAVDQNLSNGQRDLDKIQRKADLTNYGRQADDKIDGMSSLSGPERQKAKEDIQDAVNSGQSNIDQASDKDGVENAFNAGKSAVDGVVTNNQTTNDQHKDDAFNDANDAINNAENDALNKLNGLTDLTPDHKQQAKDKITSDANNARNAIKNAKSSYAIDAAKQAGKDALNTDIDDATLRNGKDKAQATIDSNLADAQKDIDAQGKLSDPEKAAAKAALKEAANAAKNNIENAADQNAVDQNLADGQRDLDKIQRKADLTNYGRQADDRIDGMSSLSDDERKQAKTDIQTAVKKGQSNIDQASDKNGVENAFNHGKSAVDGVVSKNQSANNKHKDDALNGANDAINNAENDALNKLKGLTDLTPAHKQEAENKIKSDAEDARNAVKNAKSSYDIDKAKAEGQKNLDQDLADATLRNGKDKAQATIDGNLADAQKDIDSQGKLSDPEKAAAKNDLAQAAQNAKNNIENAADQKVVDQNLADGQRDLDKIQRKADLTNYGRQADDKIDGMSSLSDPERQKAKEDIQSAVNDGQSSIDQASDKNGVENAFNDGKSAVDGVVSKNQSANNKHKDDALNGANDAINNAENDALNKLKGLTDLTPEHKQAAENKIKSDAEDARNAVKNAKSSYDIDKAKAEGQKNLDQDLADATLRNGKDKAQSTIDGDLNKAQADIDAQGKLSGDEKAAAKAALNKAAEAAKNNIENAADQNAVDQNLADGQRDLDKIQRKADLTNYGRQADDKIDGMSSLSDDERKQAKTDIQTAVNNGQSNIDQASDKNGVESAFNDGKAAVDGVVGKNQSANDQHKGDALKGANDAINNAENDALNKLNGLKDLTPAHKQAAENKIKSDAENARNAVKNAQSSYDIDKAKAEGQKNLDQDLADATSRNGKDKAQATIDSNLSDAQKDIDAQGKLSDAEKAAAKAALNKAAEDAKNNIENAANQDQVNTDLADGQRDLDKIQRKADLTNYGRQADDKIDAMSSLSDDERKQAKADIQTAVNKGQSNIDQASDKNGVESAFNDGKAAVDGVVGKNQSANDQHKGNALKGANDAINNAENDALNKLNGLKDLTPAHKQAAENKIKSDAENARNAVKNAKSSYDIDKAKAEGQKNLDQDLADATLRNGKDKAQSTIDGDLNKAQADIDAQGKLSDAEKAAAKAALNKAAEAAKNNIENAADQKAVDQNLADGQRDLDKIQRKADLTNYGRQADDKIDAMSSLSDDERKQAKADIQTAVNNGQSNIDQASDKNGVENAFNDGKAAVDGVVGKNQSANDQHKGNALKGANDAINNAENDALNKLNALTDLTPEHKQAAKDKIKSDAENARTAVKNAQSSYDIDKAKAAGQNNLNQDVDDATLRNGKDKAQKAIDDATAAALADADKQQKLTPQERLAVKAAVNRAARQAKDQIETAQSQTQVDSHLASGQNGIHQEQYQADLTNYSREGADQIDALENLSDEEKQAAQKQLDEAVQAGQKQIAAGADLNDSHSNYGHGQTNIDDIVKQQVQTDTAHKQDAVRRARQSIQVAADRARRQIKYFSHLTPEHQKEALAKVDADEQQALGDVAAGKTVKDINKVSDFGQQNMVDNIDQGDLQDNKDRADKAIDAALAKALTDLDQQGQLTAAEKDNLKAQLEQTAQTAKNQINQAKDAQTIDSLQQQAATTIDQIQRRADLTNEARLADAKIDSLNSLTAAEKQAAKDHIQAVITAGQQQITAATSVAAVEQAYQDAHNGLQQFLAEQVAMNDQHKGDALTQAQKSIHSAADQARAAINALHDLTPAHRQAALDQIAADEQKAEAAVAAGQTADEIKQASAAGQKQLADDTAAATLRNGKDKANKAVDDYVAKALADIDQQDQLTPAEKAQMKQQLQDRAEQTKNQIEGASSQAEVDQALAAGQLAMSKLQRHADLENYGRQAIAKIDALASLTPAEKQAAKDQIRAAVAKGQTDIDAANDLDAVEAAFTTAKQAIDQVVLTETNKNGQNLQTCKDGARIALQDYARRAQDYVRSLNRYPADIEAAVQEIDRILAAGLAAIDQAGNTADVTAALQDAMHKIDQVVAYMEAKEAPVLPATNEQAQSKPNWAALSLVTGLSSLLFFRNKKK
ncbi:DUF1542 domain-containing protein [Leuconostocaceae bacterium ESL0958]|nr:DUF1542 domain-containing protein [Leuconostocaceae bacterium ESL0958]